MSILGISLLLDRTCSLSSGSVCLQRAKQMKYECNRMVVCLPKHICFKNANSSEVNDANNSASARAHAESQRQIHLYNQNKRQRYSQLRSEQSLPFPAATTQPYLREMSLQFSSGRSKIIKLLRIPRIEVNYHALQHTSSEYQKAA